MFHKALNQQITHEFAASQQYVAVAFYFEKEALPQLAKLFYAQALEERNHAMMMAQYLLDRDQEITLESIPAPQVSFHSLDEPIALALGQERKVSDQVTELMRLARESGDFTGEQFIHWFLKEQVEEVASMSDLLQVASRNLDRPEELEAYVLRLEAEDEDPTAPEAAGGAL